MKVAILVCSLFLLFSCAAFGQGSPSVTPNVPADTVPAWVFYWVLGLASFFGGVMFLVIRILWDRGEKRSALSEEERGQLRQLYEWHGKVDDDQVPLWYMPRFWVELVKGLKGECEEINNTLQLLVGQSNETISDLRNQLKERLALHDRQQTKMLKLAVRVQQAVEALAGLEPPIIEDDLEDDEEAI